MRSGHKSNAVCTVSVKHFNAQSDHSPKLRDNITYSISVMDRHCSRPETSHFVDRSPLISVHDITTRMNVHGRYIILTAIYIYSQTNVKESVMLVLVAQSCLNRKG